MITIPFNRPKIVDEGLNYIARAVASGHISGDGMFTNRCHQFIEQKFGAEKGPSHNIMYCRARNVGNPLQYRTGGRGYSSFVHICIYSECVLFAWSKASICGDRRRDIEHQCKSNHEKNNEKDESDRTHSLRWYRLRYG